MSESKRGVVMILQAGDPEISGAIAEGIMTARDAGAGDLIRPAARATFPIGGRLTEEERRAVEAEIDRQAIAEGMNRRSVNKALLRVAVGNHKTAEDYQQMLFDAEVAYGESVYEPTPMQQLKEKALIVYAMFVEAVAKAYRAQDRVLEKRL